MDYKNNLLSKKRKAFTLIELLIVIAIIGILFIVIVSKVDFATDKAKVAGVQTDFRSFQVAFDTVAKENYGFNTFGWDTGDTNGDRIRNSYDKGDTNKNGKQDAGEVFIGSKTYGETRTGVYTLVKPGTSGLDVDAVSALETAINKNLEPKLHITIDTNGKISMSNSAKDPWKTEYHGVYLTNANNDGKDRGAIIMYSNGANQEFGSEHSIANGLVTITVPGNNKVGQDDMSIVSCYTYMNGYGEVKNMTTGFSNNQSFLTGNTNNSEIIRPNPDEETPQKVAYEILDGANQVVWFVKTIAFKSSAEYNKFVEVKIDGEVLNRDNYCVSQGSTVIELKDSYIASLTNKTYDIEIISTDGVALTQFTIDITPQSANLITFNIDDVEYYAESGMTLGEWTNSKYSNGKFKFFTYQYTYNGATYGPSRVLLNIEKNKEVIHKYSETSCFKPSENTSVQYYTWSTRELPDNYTILDPCPHKYEEVSTTSTCTSAGITTYTCKYCKETYQSETPANHKKTTNGICDICGANTCIINLNGVTYYYDYNMTWNDWVNSSYNIDGIQLYTYKYTINTTTYGPSRAVFYLAKSQQIIHQYSDGSCFVPSENTLIRYYSWTTRDIPENYYIYEVCPHKYKEVETTSTCTSAGITTYACEYCKETYRSETPANHKYTTNGICNTCGANTCIIILDGISYYYEYDMTWEEWLVSEYNTSSYSIVTGFKDTDNGWTHPNMVMLMNPTKDRFIAHPYSDGSRFIPSKSTLIRSYSWTTMDLSITQYVPIE